MNKNLVVANHTVGGDHLMDELQRPLAAGPSPFHDAVPNTHLAEGAPKGWRRMATWATPTRSPRSAMRRPPQLPPAQSLVILGARDDA